MTAPFVDVGRVRPGAAVRAITDALAGGLDPAVDPPRTVLGTAHGQLLLMPSEVGGHVGVKIISAAPNNPALGRPRIQGLYLLLDARTLSPAALLDGAALTTLRTPAVSVAAALPFLRALDRPPRVVVFGTGPQGRGHVDTLLDVCPPAEVVYVSRHPERTAAPDHGELPVTVVGTNRAADALRAADVVVCATTAREPLFDSALLSARAIVLAVGTHEPDAREVDGPLAARAHVIVEDVATALREAGDVVTAIAEGHLSADALIPMRRVIAEPVPFDRPVLVKTVGMAWEDLVVATAAL